MRSARQPSLQFTFGRDPSREQRALLPQQPLASPCALSRFNLRPATVAFGRGAAPGYACLASQHHDESGDEEEGAVLPQRNCQRCCLFLCVLALMAGGTGIVLRFLLARDSHPSSPAAKLAAAKLGVAPSRRPAAKPPTLRAVAAPARTTPRVVAVPVLRRSPPPPAPPWPPVGLSPHPPAAARSPPPMVVHGDEFPESDASLGARSALKEALERSNVRAKLAQVKAVPELSDSNRVFSPYPPAPPPPPWPSVSSPPNPSPPSPPMFATATPPDARSAELALSLQQSWTRTEQERAERKALATDAVRCEAPTTGDPKQRPTHDALANLVPETECRALFHHFYDYPANHGSNLPNGRKFFSTRNATRHVQAGLCVRATDAARTASDGMLIVKGTTMLRPGDMLWTDDVVEDAKLCVAHACQCALPFHVAPPPWPPDPPTFAAWLGARAANLTTIPAVAARVEARKRRAKNQTRV